MSECADPWHEPGGQTGLPCPTCAANPCAWCAPKQPGQSHSICPACFAEQMAEAKAMREEDN